MRRIIGFSAPLIPDETSNAADRATPIRLIASATDETWPRTPALAPFASRRRSAVSSGSAMTSAARRSGFSAAPATVRWVAKFNWIRWARKVGEWTRQLASLRGDVATKSSQRGNLAANCQDDFRVRCRRGQPLGAVAHVDTSGDALPSLPTRTICIIAAADLRCPTRSFGPRKPNRASSSTSRSRWRLSARRQSASVVSSTSGRIDSCFNSVASAWLDSDHARGRRRTAAGLRRRHQASSRPTRRSRTGLIR